MLADDRVAYCVAGMWANEGICVWAAEAATGKVLFLTAVERICSYNSGLFLLPDSKGLAVH